MRHARPQTLAMLTELIAAVRAKGGLREPRPGVFYRGGKAWLHFHEDPAGLFADLRVGLEWHRFRVSEPTERAAVLGVIDRSLAR
jgi:hypothetical protein